MRKLSKIQKKVILEHFINAKCDTHNINRYELIEKLEKINNYETLWNDLDRLLNDLNFSDIYEETIKKF